MLALVLASTEPSKVPFYVAGGLLAIWAVVLAYVGITNPSFPDTDSRMRGVIAITAVLVLAAIGFAIHTSAFIH
jgi:hypothetical protein